jgi:hypothetical protein
LQQDKEELRLEDLKETGTVWELTCQQVNAQPVSPAHPPPATGNEESSSGEGIYLNRPPSPSEDSSDEDAAEVEEMSCTPAQPNTDKDVCMVRLCWTFFRNSWVQTSLGALYLYAALLITTAAHYPE